MTKLAEKIAGDLTANPFKYPYIYLEKFKGNSMSFYQLKNLLNKL